MCPMPVEQNLFFSSYGTCPRTRQSSIAHRLVRSLRVCEGFPHEGRFARRRPVTSDVEGVVAELAGSDRVEAGNAAGLIC